MVHNIIIIGSGPAGLTSGVYAGRAKLEPLLIEGKQPGGQLTTTMKVENWPGIKEIEGPKLMMAMKKHAQDSNCKIISDIVTKVDFSKQPYKVYTKKGKEFQAKAVIISTGASHMKLGIPGEEEYWGKGVSVCATCDAPFYKDKNVVIIGGGNTGIYDADFLSRIAKKVTIIQNKSELTATDPIKYRVQEQKNVEIIYNTVVTEIKGENEKVKKVIIKNESTNETKELEIDGVFIAIGLKPNTKIFQKELKLDNDGYIPLKNKTMTAKKGIFACGDVVDKIYKQAITASGQGCKAALDCQEYLSNLNSK
ncbi:thioredoxin-disulfide reductase [Candidatus Dependentiae bacterium]|nr:thioredoxin-disulfide reductase [Candidatus Dependentiae bacterium]